MFRLTNAAVAKTACWRVRCRAQIAPPLRSTAHVKAYSSTSSATEATSEKSTDGQGWINKGISAIKQQVIQKGVGLSPPAPSSPAWSKAVSTAEHLVKSQGSVINPRELLGEDLSLLTNNIRKLLGSGHPVLSTISNYYFHAGGKHIRPLIVLLISQATHVAPKATSAPSQELVNKSLTGSNDVDFVGDTPANATSHGILPTQRRLAEITEMIHTASLLHDDVIDIAMTRRAQPSANAEYGNKMAILAGDFLLARASIALSRLRNFEAVELLSTAISNLVEGEFMQLRNSALNGEKSWLRHAKHMLRQSESDLLNEKFEYYMEKTYLKTASLIAQSCQAASALGGCTEEVGRAAYQYGKNVGLAFQVVDDMLDFTVSANDLGKPANADLKLGLATAPVLFAAEQFDELNVLIERNFAQPGDAEMALSYVLRSDGIERSRALAQSYCQQAIEAISVLPSSPAQTALIQLTEAVITRKK